MMVYVVKGKQGPVGDGSHLHQDTSGGSDTKVQRDLS